MPSARIRTSLDGFAEQGFPWNHPNYQHDSEPRIRYKRDPDGHVTARIDVDIEGYPWVPDAGLCPPRAPPRPSCYEPRPKQTALETRPKLGLKAKRIYADHDHLPPKVPVYVGKPFRWSAEERAEIHAVRCKAAREKWRSEHRDRRIERTRRREVLAILGI